MALDTNYVYRYRCSEYGGLICESNFRDFDPITDAWTGTNSADCRAAERMGILVGQRPKCSGGRGRISKGKDMFSSFNNQSNLVYRVKGKTTGFFYELSDLGSVLQAKFLYKNLISNNINFYAFESDTKIEGIPSEVLENRKLLFGRITHNGKIIVIAVPNKNLELVFQYNRKGMANATMFSSFMGAELSGNQKIASVATTLIGGFIGYKFIKKDKTLGAAVGLTLGAGLGTIINQYIK